MSDEDAMWAAVSASAPNDPLPLLVAADFFEESGEEDLAYALRWAAGRERRPHYSPPSTPAEYPTLAYRGQYNWYSERALVTLDRPHSRLPLMIVDAGSPFGAEVWVELDVRTIWGKLAKVLKSMRDCVGLKDPNRPREEGP